MDREVPSDSYDSLILEPHLLLFICFVISVRCHSVSTYDYMIWFIFAEFLLHMHYFVTCTNYVSLRSLFFLLRCRCCDI